MRLPTSVTMTSERPGENSVTSTAATCPAPDIVETSRQQLQPRLHVAAKPGLAGLRRFMGHADDDLVPGRVRPVLHRQQLAGGRDEHVLAAAAHRRGGHAPGSTHLNSPIGAANELEVIAVPAGGRDHVPGRVQCAAVERIGPELGECRVLKLGSNLRVDPRARLAPGCAGRRGLEPAQRGPVEPHLGLRRVEMRGLGLHLPEAGDDRCDERDAQEHARPPGDRADCRPGAGRQPTPVPVSACLGVLRFGLVFGRGHWDRRGQGLVLPTRRPRKTVRQAQISASRGIRQRFSTARVSAPMARPAGPQRGAFASRIAMSTSLPHRAGISTPMCRLAMGTSE